MNITELLEQILSHLPPVHAHSAKRVSRRFRDTLSNARAGRDLRRALGLEYHEFPQGLSPEALCRFFHRYVVKETRCRIFNVALGDRSLISPEPFPRLKIDPYKQVSFIVDENARTATLRFRLDAGSLRGASGSARQKGVIRIRPGVAGASARVYRARQRESWARIMIFSVALVVKVKIVVDFRKPMRVPQHPEEPCHVPNCQVGSHGVQHVSRNFELRDATLGNLLKFFDEVERRASLMVRLITVLLEQYQATHKPQQLWTSNVADLPWLRSFNSV